MRILLWTALAVAAAYAAVHTASLAVSQEHLHPPQDEAMHLKFYQHWMRPDAPHLSCCNKQDCYPAEASFRDGHWYAKQRETGDWVRVPSEKIEHIRPNPTTQNHVCMSPWGHVYCFIVGTGG